MMSNMRITVVMMNDFDFNFSKYVWLNMIKNLFIGSTDLFDENVIQRRFFQFKFPDKTTILQSSEYFLGHRLIFNLQITAVVQPTILDDTRKAFQKLQWEVRMDQ